MEGSRSVTQSDNTPRTPHSPSRAAGAAVQGPMVSPRGAAAGAAVLPVTARTWQALAGAPPPAEDSSLRRMSVYTNGLYHGGQEAVGAAHPHALLGQPASARPGTPTPKSAERLQQQRIVAVPSCLQVERAASPSRQLQQAAAAGAGLSTANVPSVAAAAAEPAGGGSVPAPSLQKERRQHVSQQHQQGQQAQQLLPESEAQPSTVLVAGAGGAYMRTSAISLASLAQQHQPGTSPRPAAATAVSADGGIAAASPRVRQQVLRGFSGAVPVGTSTSSGATSPLGTSPRPTLHGERGRGSGNGARPSTPSFQPVGQPARPATALAGPSGATAGAAAAGANFSIRAEYGRAAQGPTGSASGRLPAGAGAYPRPPMTAPPKASAQQAGDSQPQPGSLASYGISAGAFVGTQASAGGAGAKAAAVEDSAEQDGKEAPRVLTQEAMLACTSFASKADLRRFLLVPGPADKPLCCKVLRSGGGLLKGGPQYTLLVEQEGGKAATFLATARKRKGSPGSATYVLSVDQHDMSRHSASYVGKLRSNFVGTEFVLYDDGEKGCKGGSALRCELGAALYQTNVLGTKGPRKMTVLIPKLEPGGQRPLELSPRGEHDTLLGQYKSYNLASCVVLRNKPPRWNQAIGAYCLNFGGRVTQASVKNFQLVSVDNMERTILQFGKVAKDTFTMDYCYPMTALQAFMICLSSISSKLACE